jgi:hypothetical protein
MDSSTATPNLPDIDACIRKEDARHTQSRSQKEKNNIPNSIKIKVNGVCKKERIQEIKEGKKQKKKRNKVKHGTNVT